MRQSHYCGDYTALTTTKWGAKIYVDTRDTSLAPHIMVEGDWEPWVTNAIATALQQNKGCVFIDVGANVGWYTLLAAGLGASRVWAFEPNPRMAELLRKTVAVNGIRDRVTLTEAACGAQPGQARLVVDAVEAGGGHLEALPTRLDEDTVRAGGDAYHSAVWRKGACDVVRLDDVVLPENMVWASPIPPIIKIDVEGYEPQVLAGAPRLMQARPILFIEHHRDQAHEQLLQSLYDQGYELRHVQHKGPPSEPLAVAAAAVLGDAETILCAPKGR